MPTRKRSRQRKSLSPKRSRRESLKCVRGMNRNATYIRLNSVASILKLWSRVWSFRIAIFLLLPAASSFSSVGAAQPVPHRLLVGYFPQWGAVSTGRCNAGLKFTSWSIEAQSLPWTLIEAQGYLVEVGLGVAG
jgi:hypothetical protein